MHQGRGESETQTEREWSLLTFQSMGLLNSIYFLARTDLGSIINAPSRSIGDRETLVAPPALARQGERSWVAKKLHPKQKWHEAGRSLKREAEKMPYGRKSAKELLRQASQLETANLNIKRMGNRRRGLSRPGKVRTDWADIGLSDRAGQTAI